VCYVDAKGSTSDADINIIYRSNFKVTVTKRNKTTFTRIHTHTHTHTHTNAKICNFCHMYNCKELFKLQTTNKTTEPNPAIVVARVSGHLFQFTCLEI